MSAAATRARVIVPAGGITVAAQIKHAHVTVSPAGAVHLHLVLEGNVYARKPYGSGSAAQFVATRNARELMRTRPVVTISAAGWAIDDIDRDRLVLVDVLHLDWPRPADYTEAAQGPDGAKA